MTDARTEFEKWFSDNHGGVKLGAVPDGKAYEDDLLTGYQAAWNTQQQEVLRLRKAIDKFINNPAWSIEDWIYDVREGIRDDYEGNSWEHPDVIAYQEAVDALKQALNTTAT